MEENHCDTKPVKDELPEYESFYHDHERPTLIFRRMLEGDVSLTTLENAASTADDFLTIMDPILQRATHDGVDIRHLTDQIQDLRTTPTGAEVVIGLFGASGAGKTSLANALLDEESILITNTKEACTATVTSVRYNKSADPEKLYIAKIRYVDETTWRSDLTLSLRDLRHEKEGEEPDLAAVQIARAKLKAVYADIDEDDLLKMKVDDLIRHLDNPNILGQTIAYEGPSYKRMRTTIEAIAKGRIRALRQLGNTQNIPTTKGACWPLIREIKIYIKNDLLSGGLVLVDLPGSQDSNAARVAVSKQYERKCTRLLVVANIVRAVTDKGSQDLMNDRLKYDLARMDAFNTVTIVCTHTDQIDVDSYCRDFDAGKDVRDENKKLKIIKKDKKQITTELQKKIAKCKKVKARMNELTQQSRGSRRTTAHTESTPCLEGPKRRASSNAQIGPNKRAVTDVPDLGDLTELSQTLEEEIEELQEEEERAAAHHASTQAQLVRLCIEDRNEWVKKNIKIRWAEEIRQLDRDLGQNDEGTSAPIHDYSHFGDQLVVHTVSSMQYQKKHGRLSKCTSLPGFPHINSTGIPALKNQLREMTEEQKMPKIRHYLDKVVAFLNSLEICIAFDRNTVVGKIRQDQLQIWLDNRFSEHKKTSELKMDDACEALAKVMQTSLYDYLPDVVASANIKVGAVLKAWARLPWGTYKAVCRREGLFKRKSETFDFNQDLALIAFRGVLSRQHKEIFRALPDIVKDLVADQNQELKKFHDAVMVEVRRAGVPLRKLPLLDGQIRASTTRTNTLTKDLLGLVKSCREKAWAQAEKHLVACMLDTYAECTEQKGTQNKMYDRMRAIMKKQLDENGGRIYQEAIGKFEECLRKLEEELHTTSQKSIEAIRELMRKEYRQLLIDDDEEIPEVERLMHAAIGENLGALTKEASSILLADNVPKDENMEEPEDVVPDLNTETDSEPIEESDESDSDDSDDESEASCEEAGDGDFDPDEHDDNASDDSVVRPGRRGKKGKGKKLMAGKLESRDSQDSDNDDK